MTVLAQASVPGTGPPETLTEEQEFDLTVRLIWRSFQDQKITKEERVTALMALNESSGLSKEQKREILLKHVPQFQSSPRRRQR